MSRLLLEVLVATWRPTGQVTIAVDETLELRWGPQIRKRDHSRDSLAASRQVNVSSSGLRWLVFALVVNAPWTPYALALPLLSVLLTTPKVSAQLGRPAQNGGAGHRASCGLVAPDGARPGHPLGR